MLSLSLLFLFLFLFPFSFYFYSRLSHYYPLRPRAWSFEVDLNKTGRRAFLGIRMSVGFLFFLFFFFLFFFSFFLFFHCFGLG